MVCARVTAAASAHVADVDLEIPPIGPRRF
jgi:hypothetical protein